MPESSIVKYLIRIKFEIEGVVEKADVIGAIFGQTEGLFGPEMNLNELQKNWKIGRIEIKLESKHDHTNGEVQIPIATDVSTAAIIAAAIENIDKVGPCSARFQLGGIEDVRAFKRKVIAERAKEIMKDWASRTTSHGEEIIKEVSASVKSARIIQYGKENLPAGPGIYMANEIYLVEGRADVLNLLRCGIENVIALEGTKVPESIIKLSREKTITAFLDGDRGGDLILKELQQVTNIKKILRAPAGKEVEDLTPVEILAILRAPEEKNGKREPVKPVSTTIAEPLLAKIKELYQSIDGTLEASILDDKMVQVSQAPVNQLIDNLSKVKNAKIVVFDGIITQRLVDICGGSGVETIVGHRIGEIAKKPVNTTILTFSQIGVV